MPLVLLALAGYAISKAPAAPEFVVVAPPAEGGTRYVAVEGDGMSSPQVLAARLWKRKAKKACEGDYIPFNDEPPEAEPATIGRAFDPAS